MITIVLLVTGALLVLLLTWRVLRGEYTTVRDIHELQGKIEYVDFLAFKNVVDSRDEDFLRKRLKHGEFRRIQRARTRAAIEYLSCTARNATLLFVLGQTAAKGGNVEVSAKGKELANIALSVRINCLLAMAQLYLTLVLPVSHFSLDPVLERYPRMQASLDILASAQTSRPV